MPLPPPTFSVQLNAQGSIRWRAVVTAIETGICGDYYKGTPYQPSDKEIHDRLPTKYRKAFDRALKWCQENSMSGRNIPQKCDLTTLKGKPMGTLFVLPNWET